MNTTYLKHLFKLRAHIGPKSAAASDFGFLFGTKHRQNIFDLQKTFKYLLKACFFLFQSYSTTRGRILFVSTHPKLDYLAKKTALAVGESYVIEKWTSGTLTNWRETQKAYKFYTSIKASQTQSSPSETGTREQRLYFQLKKRFVGLASIHHRPNLIVVLNPKSNRILLNEAKILHIPVISFVEGDFNSSLIPYPIPCNTKSYDFMNFCMQIFMRCIKKAQNSLTQAS